MAEKLCTRCQAPGGEFVIRGKDDSGVWLPWEEDTDRHAPAPFGKCRAMVVLSPVGICQMCEASDLRAVKAAKPGPSLASRERFNPATTPPKEKKPKRKRIPLEEKVQKLKAPKKAVETAPSIPVTSAKAGPAREATCTALEVERAIAEEAVRQEEIRIQSEIQIHLSEVDWIDKQMDALRRRRHQVDKARAKAGLRLRRLRSQARTA